MSIVTIDTETISIATSTVSTYLYINGMINDEISDTEEFQKCINRLIAKHETAIGKVITDVHIVCNTFGLSLLRYAEIKKFNEVSGIMHTNSFTMKTSKIYECYSLQSLKIAINTFANIGIHVHKIHSAFGLFLFNKKTLSLQEKASFLFVGGKKMSFCMFDGAGNVVNVYTFDSGLHDIIEYIFLSVRKRLPHIEREIVIIILQSFIYFNEVDFIQKVHTTHHIQSKKMSVITYEVVLYISMLLRGYLKKTAQSLKIPTNIKCFVYIQKEYMQSIVSVLAMAGVSKACAVNKRLLYLECREKDSGFIQDMLRFIFKK